MPKVFISYRHEDSQDVAGRLYDHLTAKFDSSGIFKDVDSIPLGIDFREHLKNAVGECDVMLVIIGPRWASSAGGGTGDPRKRRAKTGPAERQGIDGLVDFVRIEIEAALERSIPVIPVLVSGASMPLATDLPDSVSPLAFRQAMHLRPDPDFRADTQKLIAWLERIDQQPREAHRLPAEAVARDAARLQVVAEAEARERALSRFWNKLIKVSVVVGLAASVVSGIAILWSKGPEFRSRWLGKDHVEVLSFYHRQGSSSFRLSAANRGNRSAHFSQISVGFVNGPEVILKLDSEVKPGKIASESKPEPSGRAENVVFGRNPKIRTMVRDRAFEGDDPCFHLTFWATADPNLIMVRGHQGDRFWSWPVEAKIYYYSESKPEVIAESFEAIATVSSPESPECNRLWKDGLEQ